MAAHVDHSVNCTFLHSTNKIQAGFTHLWRSINVFMNGLPRHCNKREHSHNPCIITKHMACALPMKIDGSVERHISEDLQSYRLGFIPISICN